MRPVPIPPQPGQESVWDYPRPPRLEATSKRLQAIYQGETVADTERGFRVLETSHPPAYYFPPEDVRLTFLKPTSRQGYCEWKGRYQYYDVQVGEQVSTQGAWLLTETTPSFTEIQGYFSFFANRMDACSVAGELVVPQPGDFYGGWITANIVGPFKGAPGTWGW